MKLTAKTTALVVTFALFITAVTSFITFRIIQSSIKEEVGNREHQLAVITMDKIDRIIYNRYREIIEISEDSTFEDFMSNPDKTGLDRVQSKINELTLLSGPWDVLRLVDNSGKIILSSHPEENGQVLSPDSLSFSAYQKVLAGEEYISDLSIPNDSPYPTIAMSAPIEVDDQLGRPVVGVVIGYFSWTFAAETLQEISSEGIYLVNNQGYEIASKNHFNFDEILRQKIDNQDFDKIKETKSGTDIIPNFYDGTKSLTAYTTESGYQSYLGNNWILILQTPTKIAFAQATQATVQMIFIVSLTMFIGLIIMLILFNRGVILPIVNLTQIANKMTQGNFSIRATVKSKDEVGQLANAFNQMATSVESSHQSLESQVKERTFDLEKIKNDLEQRQEALLNVLDDAKELEDSLKEEKERTELIVSSMGEGLIVVDGQFNISAINPTAERLLDVNRKDVLGHPWAKTIAAYRGDAEIPFDQRTSVVVIKKGVTIPTRLEDNHYYLTITGKKFPIISVTSPIMHNDVVVGAVKVFRDATSEKESKEIVEKIVQERTRELAEEQALSSSILEHAGEGIVLTNDAGLITYLNPAFTEMTGFKTEALKGKSFANEIKAFNLKEELIPPSQRSDAAAVTAENQEVKMLLETFSGEKLAVIVNAAPVRVAGEFKGVVRVLHDYNEDLNLQRQKDDFFSIASHELRTPLSVISGNLDTILQGYGKNQLGPEDTQLLKDSLTSSERLIKIVEDFLNISRLDQGRLTFSIQPVDPCKIGESVVDELKILANQKNISLEFSCTIKHPPVMADEGLLREIITNLIGNSLKFTEKGGIKVEHHIKGQMLETTVTDTGMGIDPEMQPLLFQRFQQAMKRTLSREAGGTGLGLYISREFARKMGGDLWLAESTPSKGSVFVFSLPLAENINQLPTANN